MALPFVELSLLSSYRCLEVVSPVERLRVSLLLGVDIYRRSDLLSLI